MDFRQLVEEARTCRRFHENQPLAMENLEWLVDCARLSPCGRNAQELRFIIVAERNKCLELFSLTRWAGALKDWGGPHAGERPTAFIAVLMPEKGRELHYWDTGIACQTIQLAATSRGWGCCMIQSFDHQAVPALLEVPADMKVGLVLGLGVAKEKRVITHMPADGSFTYWRDNAGVHYVPKRSLDELIIGRF
ncbi:MAG: nitroreductase family protein [Desulfovibrio sp.]|nr:nitroreductase family protein [Desulfovibrio sp.]